MMLPKKINQEIDRIFYIAKMYKEVQVLLPKYKSGYLDAFAEVAERFKDALA